MTYYAFNTDNTCEIYRIEKINDKVEIKFFNLLTDETYLVEKLPNLDTFYVEVEVEKLS